MKQESYAQYIGILREELIAALGCTEPIAIAYAAAKAREVLGEEPDHIVAECSGNIIKNVKGVIVPTTKNLRGIEAAAVIGVVGGDASRGLEVLTSITEEHLKKAKSLIDAKICEEKWLNTAAKLHIIVRVFKDEHSAMVEIIHIHTGVVRIEKDGNVLVDVPHREEIDEDGEFDRGSLTVQDIIEFANTVDLDHVKDILERQIQYNTAISQEGLKHSYGAQVGKTLLDTYGDSNVRIRARATAAAGSDARMGGCEMPVVINSGSGNQGMTIALPIIEYAKELKADQDTLYRALCVGNLVAVRIKEKMGRLSAFCGAVSAGVGAGAGIAYLHNCGEDIIEKTIINTLGNVSGIVCDGAKPSCAAKISSAVDAAILGFEMAQKDRVFNPGEGLIKDDVEQTIDNIAQMAKNGMQATDEEILHLMVNS